MSDTSSAGLYAVAGSFIGLSAIAVGIRFYGRLHQGTNLGADDWFALVGVITFIAASAISTLFVAWKQEGYDTASLTPKEKAARAFPTFQISLAYDFLLTNTLACAKLSALFFYRRIFAKTSHPLFRTVIVITVVVVAAWYITIDVLSVLQCGTSFSSWWDGTFHEHCSKGNKVWAKTFGLSDLLLDIWVLLLPIPQTDWSRRLSIVGVFLLACVGLGAAIARVVFFFEATGGAPAVLYIGVLEAGMTITVINLPSIWHICTSTIPQNVLRGVRSFQTLNSPQSQSKHRLPIEDDNDSQQMGFEKSIASSDSIYGSGGHEAPHEASPAKGSTALPFRNDLEGGSHSHAYVARAFDGDTGTVRLNQSLPANAIRVHSSVEVRRDSQ